MDISFKSRNSKSFPTLFNLPFLGWYARSRGPAFLVFWAHRISGLILVLYLLLHVLTLSTLADPAQFTAKMQAFNTPLFLFLEFLLAVPLIFHALNGVRLMLYESFGIRNEAHLLTWLSSLGGLYLLLLALLMAMGNQFVSPFLFGMILLTLCLLASMYCLVRIRSTHNPLFWKIQRISAAFLLFALPGHMLYMHLEPSLGHEAAPILARLALPLMQVFYLLTLGCALYHAAFGLSSFLRDSTAKPWLRFVLSCCIVLALVWIVGLGLRLTLFLA